MTKTLAGVARLRNPTSCEKKENERDSNEHWTNNDAREKTLETNEISCADEVNVTMHAIKTRQARLHVRKTKIESSKESATLTTMLIIEDLHQGQKTDESEEIDAANKHQSRRQEQRSSGRSYRPKRDRKNLTEQISRGEERRPARRTKRARRKQENDVEESSIVKIIT